MSRAFAAVYACTHSADWPYDDGDDPALRASAAYRAQGGQVSWGVCRGDLREDLAPGDVVVFFAADSASEPAPVYRLAAFARVERSVAQVAVWSDHDLAVYRQYQNLLIRPDPAGGWQHYEPGLAAGHQEHGDWLWRLVERRHHTAQEIERWQVRGRVPDGANVSWGANYVLFEPEGSGTTVLDNPPVVARLPNPKSTERWEQDEFSRALWRLTIGMGKQMLRSKPRGQYKHPLVPLMGVRPRDLYPRLLDLCARHGLKSR